MKEKKGNGKRMRRTRFLARTLLSSPAVVFVYTPLLVSHAAAGMAVPFATGRFIDALLAGGLAPVGAFVVLAALLVARAAVAPGLQRLLLSRARNIELRLQERALEAIMELSPAELSAHADGELVAKLTRDTCAVGTFVSGLYQRLTVAAVTMFGAGLALHTRSAALGGARGDHGQRIVLTLFAAAGEHDGCNNSQDNRFHFLSV